MEFCNNADNAFSGDCFEYQSSGDWRGADCDEDQDYRTSLLEIEIDCSGVVNGDATEDECGVCNGDNSTCTGCTDTEALNYDETALIDDGLEITHGVLASEVATDLFNIFQDLMID